MKPEYWKILNKIEQWAERLPYSHMKIEISLKDGTELVYEDERHNPIGFVVEGKQVNNEKDTSGMD